MNNTGNPALTVILTILGILTIALLAGVLIFQQRDNSTTGLDMVFSSQQENPVLEEIDPFNWVGDDVTYPPLEEAKETVDVITEPDTDSGASPSDNLESESVVERVISNPIQQFTQITENAFWVQVFSSSDVSRSEYVRDELALQGLPATIQTREVDGKIFYRVRIGAFEEKEEAESYAHIVRKIPRFVSSYVVIAPITRQIPLDG